MWILEKVIFDTNTLRNTESKTFLGGRDELKKFSNIAEIIFPDIVIEELKYQKRKQLEKHKKSFLDNPFHWLRNINQQDTENFDNEAHITDLENKEDIKYSVIKLQDYSVLEQIKELALKKLPPFEDWENTDKGFKDTYIYFTILEYLQIIPDKYIFVCTKDGRFKEALERHPNIKVIKDFEEFRKESVSFFYDEYFLEKLKESVSPDITKENINDFWLSINGNQILRISVAEENFRVEVENRDIISIINELDPVMEFDAHDPLTSLIKSTNFQTTHSAIVILSKYKNYLSDKEILQILEATISNNQINWILTDEDVKQFIGDLFESKKETLENEMRKILESLF